MIREYCFVADQHLLNTKRLCWHNVVVIRVGSDPVKVLVSHLHYARYKSARETFAVFFLIIMCVLQEWTKHTAVRPHPKHRVFTPQNDVHWALQPPPRRCLFVNRWKAASGWLMDRRNESAARHRCRAGGFDCCCCWCCCCWRQR